MKIKLLAALAATSMLASTASAEIIFAHGANQGNPRYAAAEKWAELYSACTGESVNHAASASMGDDVEMLTSAAAGIIQVSANSTGPMSQIVPEFGLILLPFLFADRQMAWDALDGELGAEYDRLAQEKGYKVLGFWDNGFRHVTHTKKNVPTPADIAGMKIRTPPGEISIRLFESIGASPAPLAFSELASALQSGAFDGQENPLVNIWAAKLYESTPYITLTGHQYDPTPVVAGMGWWSGLDAASQECALSATMEAGAMQRQMSADGDATLRPKMEAAGAIFAEGDTAAFQAAAAPVYDHYSQTYPDFVALLKKSAGIE